MFFHAKNLFDWEKKSVFLINFFLIIVVILFVFFRIDFSYFFYGSLLLTLVLSYFFFQKSKKLAKMLIVTNLFIFFYFLFPEVMSFFMGYFGSKAFYIIMIYNLLIALLFLKFSGYHQEFFDSIKNVRLPILGAVFLVGFVIGFFFYLVKEPIPELFVSFVEQGSLSFIGIILLNSFIIGLSEQMIFSGFLFNVYKNLTSKWDAFFQVAIIFVLFHMLRFEVLAKYYFVNFNDFFIGYISLYYLFLFLFMLVCLYVYSFKGRKYKGSFIYAVMVHFAADFSLFLFYILSTFS